MRYLLLILLASFMSISLCAQTYFPPTNSNQWDTLAPDSLGWCQPQIDSLYTFLDENNTKAFMVLKDGKIVLEQYFDDHTDTSFWYWASAGKTLNAFMTGLAQEQGLLDIDDPTTDYLDTGWTACTPVEEAQITIRHQLTMTTGLDDGVMNPDCTDDTCLTCLANPGDRWAYHNGPYTQIGSVLEEATGLPLNWYLTQQLKTPIGMDGAYLPLGYNRVYWSTARSMARYGLLMLNNGVWDGNPVMTDTAYFNAMITPSQALNEAYGYLWWLNGSNSFKAPGLQFNFPGMISPNAPDDMYAAMGKNGQFINVIPSENMVWIRMGDAPDSSLVPFLLNDAIWQHINELECLPLSQHTLDPATVAIKLFPNPTSHELTVSGITTPTTVTLYNALGQPVKEAFLSLDGQSLNLGELPNGVYHAVFATQHERFNRTIVKQ